MNGASDGKLNRYLRLVDGAKLLHELLGAGNDVVATRLEELAGVKALALLILAGFDVLAGSLSNTSWQSVLTLILETPRRMAF